MMDVFWCSVMRRHGTLGQSVPPIDVFTECLRFWSAAGVRTGQQKIAWSQIMETLYRVVPIQRVRAFRTDRSGAHHVDQVRRRTPHTRAAAFREIAKVPGIAEADVKTRLPRSRVQDAECIGARDSVGCGSEGGESTTKTCRQSQSKKNNPCFYRYLISRLRLSGL